MPYSEVEPDEVKARIARGEDVYLLDVREPDEVEAWAYPIAVNIPLLSDAGWTAENVTGGAVAWAAGEPDA